MHRVDSTASCSRVSNGLDFVRYYRGLWNGFLWILKEWRNIPNMIKALLEYIYIQGIHIHYTVYNIQTPHQIWLANMNMKWVWADNLKGMMPPPIINLPISTFSKKSNNLYLSCDLWFVNRPRQALRLFKKKFSITLIIDHRLIIIGADDQAQMYLTL